MNASLMAYMFTEHGVFPETTLNRPYYEKLFMLAALELKNEHYQHLNRN